jgi:hypothetical protein
MLASTGRPKAESKAESIALSNKETADLFEYKMIGRSANQRRMNVIIIGERVNPELKIFIMAGQHGDEIYSRKATERLISNLLKTRAKEFPSVGIAILPDANPDGSRKHRRRTASGLDMNRDHIRLKTPEVRAIHSFISSWKPNLIIDVHNYPPTREYLDQRNYAYCHDILIDTPTNLAVRNRLEQEELENLIKDVQLDLEPHNYSCARYVLVSPQGRVRHSTYDIIDARNYLSLRYDTLTILLEGREPLTKDAKNEIERSISSQYFALLSVLKWAKTHMSSLSNNSHALISKEGDRIPIRSKNVQSDQPFKMNFENTSTKEIEEVALPINLSNIKATRHVKLPSAYAIPVDKNRLIDHLHNDGFISERINDSKLQKVEKYLILSYEPPKKKDDFPSKVELIATEEEQDLYNYEIFPINQQGGHSLALLLEPQSKFGLRRYGFLDLEVVPGLEYPIVRCLSS